ncbi:MAG: helix-turn-helix transcriptional regulator [Gammaproteobacteria bacterium]|nr:helix-turn-helix transcriptional regulator [Gammaproteobacteria bacterium]
MTQLPPISSLVTEDARMMAIVPSGVVIFRISCGVEEQAEGHSLIKAWRKYKKLTQDDLAEAMKITQPALRCLPYARQIAMQN